MSASQVLRFSVLCEYITFVLTHLLYLHHRLIFGFPFPYSSSPFSFFLFQSFFAFISSALLFFSILFIAPSCILPSSCSFSSHFTFSPFPLFTVFCFTSHIIDYPTSYSRFPCTTFYSFLFLFTTSFSCCCSNSRSSFFYF